MQAPDVASDIAVPALNLILSPAERHQATFPGLSHTQESSWLQQGLATLGPVPVSTPHPPPPTPVSGSRKLHAPLQLQRQPLGGAATLSYSHTRRWHVCAAPWKGPQGTLTPPELKCSGTRGSCARPGDSPTQSWLALEPGEPLLSSAGAHGFSLKLGHSLSPGHPAHSPVIPCGHPG